MCVPAASACGLPNTQSLIHTHINVHLKTCLLPCGSPARTWPRRGGPWAGPSAGSARWPRCVVVVGCRVCFGSVRACWMRRLVVVVETTVRRTETKVQRVHIDTHIINRIYHGTHRCFSPPESLRPRSPTTVSYLRGSASMKGLSCAACGCRWACDIVGLRRFSGRSTIHRDNNPSPPSTFENTHTYTYISRDARTSAAASTWAMVAFKFP